MNPLMLATGSVPWYAYLLPCLSGLIALVALIAFLRNVRQDKFVATFMCALFVMLSFFVVVGVAQVREPYVAATAANRSAVEQHYHSTITEGSFPASFRLRSKTGRESAGCSVEVDGRASAQEVKTHVLCSGMEPESN